MTTEELIQKMLERHQEAKAAGPEPKLPVRRPRQRARRTWERGFSDAWLESYTDRLRWWARAR